MTKAFKKVGYFDCPGGGQVVVEGTTAYVAHMTSPDQNTIIDVSDPKNPRHLAGIDLGWPKGVHAHKVRVAGDIMITNLEGIAREAKTPEGFKGGLNIYDVSNPAKPRHLRKWDCAERGVHRFTFDGRYAYISPCLDGYRQNIVMILDLKNPEKPEEVGRWWMEGQWEAGGEECPWDMAHPARCHHPMRLGDHLYTSYWHGGWVILDISDMSKPKQVSGMNWTKQFNYPVHTCLPIPFEVEGRRLMLVTDEDALPRSREKATGSLIWLVDVTDLENPIPFSSFRVGGLDGTQVPMHSTCHQPTETVKDCNIPVAYFSHGLISVDISDPHRMKQTAQYLPTETGGRIKSNDVCWDDRGLLYLLDRDRGLSIVEPM